MFFDPIDIGDIARKDILIWILGHDTDEHIGIECTNESAIVGTIAMIPQNEIVIFRDRIRFELV